MCKHDRARIINEMLGKKSSNRQGCDHFEQNWRMWLYLKSIRADPERGRARGDTHKKINV